jgi:O-methyltransferase involved in polyketide biosynthesis
MATQFWRIDDGSVRYVDVDLPEVIRLRRLLVNESERYRMVGCSVLDFSWMDAVPDLERPVMFQAEGLFMYLPKEEVVGLVREMARRVRTGEPVAEAAPPGRVVLHG